MTSIKINPESNYINDSKRVHILIIDDDKDVREVLMKGLIIAEYECSVSENAKETLKVLEEKEVDIAIVDIELPDMNGLELTEIIKKKYDSDVIVITGHSGNFKYGEVIEKGASDFLIKPVDLKELVIRIKRVLRERSLQCKQRKAMEAVRESEEKFWKLSDSAQDAIIMLDDEGNISFWNKAAEKMYGYSIKEVLGRCARSL